MRHIELYTDGACSGNPGPGGWAAIAFNEDGDNIMQHGGGFRKTTNNRMEMYAVAQGLADLHDGIGRDTDVKVTVFSDSQLVVNTMTQGWSKKTNRDLWEKIDAAVSLFGKVEFVKVKGHANNTRNNLADEVAVVHSSSELATGIDAIYEDICKENDTVTGTSFSNTLFPVESSEPVIDEIRLKNVERKDERFIEVYLSNDTVVKITPLYEGFEQTECTRSEAAVTVDVAMRFNKWLHGGRL